MKKVLMVALVLLIGMAFLSSGCVQKDAPDKVIAEKDVPEKVIAKKQIPDKVIAKKDVPEIEPGELKVPAEIVAEKVAAEKVAAEKVAAEKVAAEKDAEERETAVKVAAEKEAAEKVAAEKIAAEKIAAEMEVKVSGFVGQVTMIDTNLIQVKGNKTAITFNASNPELMGYKAIGDVMVGDTVAAKYTKDGIIITKLKWEAPKKATVKKATVKKATVKLRPKASGFVGQVTMIDTNLIQVKGNKTAITFNASNPELVGYKAIGDVMVGDTVAAKYTKDGIIITKFKKTARRK